jgi:outer membrane protein TolC
MQDYSLKAAQAAFLPTLTTSYSYNNSSSVSSNQLDGGARVATQSNSLNSSLNKRLPWQGGTASVTFNNSRSSSNNAFNTRNPNYSSNLSLQYSQPLLSGRTIDSQRNALETGQIQRQITDIQLLTQIERIKNSVRTAYWSLRQSIEAIEIQRRSLELSRRNYEDTKVKVADN